MLEQELEKKLEKFLLENKRIYYKNSIKYSGIRNMKRLNGDHQKLHLVNFMVPISDQPYDGNGLYFATFDEKTHRLLEIVGPQSFEKIEE
ncbi:hypothetical protein CHRYSEOSP005_02650 [Chryseobacterium sp. Alg-005]|uniref:hypothetical protein n=1 Tax=Chryseobacterium sp. Alg-005 TaxID=3159516 RepID=UPI003555B983